MDETALVRAGNVKDAGSGSGNSTGTDSEGKMTVQAQKQSPADLAHLEQEARSRENEEKRKSSTPKVKGDGVVRELVMRLFRKEVTAIKELESYDDNNFRVETAEGDTYTLKVHNGLDSMNDALLVALNHVVMFAASKGFNVPAPLRSRGGNLIRKELLPVADGTEAMLSVRLLSWVHGPTMVSGEVSPDLMEKAGAYLGRLQVELGSFYDKALLREHPWDLKHTGMLSGYVEHIKDPEQRRTVEDVIEAFRTTVMTTSAHLRHGVIHGDFNDANVVVSADRTEVAGVIDFGDAAYTWLVNDIAIGMAYAMMSPLARKTGDPLGAAALLLRGFCSVRQLVPAESRHLKVLVAARLAASLTLGAYSMYLFPENEYLKLHSSPSWKVLKMLWYEVPEEHTKALWEKAVMLVPGEVISKVSGSMWDGSKRKRLEPKPVTFVTGNANKLKEVTKILGSTFAFPLENRKVDLPEIQGEPLEVARKKCKLAAEQVKGAVMVEDTGLCFEALDGLPGPYIKWFLDGVGNAGLNTMLQAFGDKSAYAQCIFAFCPGPGHEVKVFDGRTRGYIVPARGPNSFGWDPIFEPEGRDMTFAEMHKEEKNEISHRGRALAMLKEYVAINSDKIVQQMYTVSDAGVAGEGKVTGSSTNGKALIAFVQGETDAVDGEVEITDMGERLAARLSVGVLRLEGDDALPELQGDAREVISEKARKAADRVKGAVIVENFSLGVKAMAGLPGPYVHAFLRKTGPRGLQKVVSGFDDHVAVAEHYVSFCAGPGAAPKVFEGKVSGRVVPPRAPSATVEAEEGSEIGDKKEAFLAGWQEIFAPDGDASSDEKTLAQMEDAERAQYLPRRHAISALEEYLRSEADDIAAQIKESRDKARS